MAGLRKSLTVKGGVVMSGITDLIRRATMDMDVDFLHYSISKASVRHFVAILNRASDCRIQIAGPIVDLKHQDYRGKRLFLKITDAQKVSVKTKLDIGTRVKKTVMRKLLKTYIFDDAKLRETDTTGILSRLNRIFKDKGFLRGLKDPTFAWLDVPAEDATAAILYFIDSL